MSECKMTRQAYEKTIQEDIDAVNATDMDSISKWHIIEVLRCSTKHYYGKESTESLQAEIASLKQQLAELERKHANQAGFIASYASCLNDISEIRNIPGSTIDSCRHPKEIRTIVEALLRRLAQSVRVHPMREEPKERRIGLIRNDGEFWTGRFVAGKFHYADMYPVEMDRFIGWIDPREVQTNICDEIKVHCCDNPSCKENLVVGKTPDADGLVFCDNCEKEEQ